MKHFVLVLIFVVCAVELGSAQENASSNFNQNPLHFEKCKIFFSIFRGNCWSAAMLFGKIEGLFARKCLANQWKPNQRCPRHTRIGEQFESKKSLWISPKNRARYATIHAAIGQPKNSRFCISISVLVKSGGKQISSGNWQFQWCLHCQQNNPKQF